VRHTYECPLRWADMDQLGHMNNVAYADYLQEARIELFADHPGLRTHGEGLVVVRHELDYRAPLSFRKRSVRIDTWVSDVRAGSFTLAHEIYDTGDEEGTGVGGRVVYLRASTRLAPVVLATGAPRRLAPEENAFLQAYLATEEPRRALSAAGSSQHVYPVRVRWSDLDTYHHVNNVKHVEYFQEARIAYSMAMYRKGDDFGQFVVARVDVEYLRPVAFRRTPYEVHSWISHVGTTSATWVAELRDADTVLTRTQVVTVGFDPATQRSAPLPEDHHRRLVEQLQASGLR
jgi:acyl-CoA thioester hydrolase